MGTLAGAASTEGVMVYGCVKLAGAVQSIFTRAWPGPIYSDLGRTPLHKSLKAEELRQTEAVVSGGGAAVSVLGTLPELAPVDAAGEHGPVFLRLMAENGLSFSLEIVRADRDDAFD